MDPFFTVRCIVPGCRKMSTGAHVICAYHLLIETMLIILLCVAIIVPVAYFVVKGLGR